MQVGKDLVAYLLVGKSPLSLQGGATVFDKPYILLKDKEHPSIQNGAHATQNTTLEILEK